MREEDFKDSLANGGGFKAVDLRQLLALGNGMRQMTAVSQKVDLVLQALLPLCG